VEIYQIKCRFVNSYVIENEGRLFVVDVEFNGEDYVLDYVRDTLGRNPEHIELVLCSHDDRDHSGGIEALAKKCGAVIGMPYASYSLMKKLWHNPYGVYYRPVTAMEESLRPRMWRMYLDPHRQRRFKRSPKKTVPVSLHALVREPHPDIHIKDKQALPGFPDWVAIHTPGHSWDSCCYFHQATRSLITGDTLLGSRKREKVLFPAIFANPRQMAKTVVRLRRLKPMHVYPGHGSAFHGDGLLDHL